MPISKILFLFALIAAAASLASAQDDDPVKIDTSIVRLNVGVVDKRGRPITTLTRSNFSVFENGVKQDISRFEPTAAPFSLVIVLDMSGSTLSMRQVMKQSAFRFIDALSPEDRIAVVEFYDKINLRNDFTTDRRTIANSIEVSNGRGKTQFYKALDFALNKLAGEGSRRKAVIVLSDGVDTTVRDADREFLSKLPEASVPGAIKPEDSALLQRILNKADALGATIYPLALPTGDPAKLADPTPRQIEMYKASRARLQMVADRTGGTLHKINRLEEMGTLYAQVAAELRTLYTIEYQPQNLKRDGAWRTIRIEVDDPELLARTRQGYFAR
ncbi:MAG: VWA domain-containing protein [Pyrinomonadaceae bacterium]